ncbi:hypothetical protein J1614_000047 [Plenodomus biglobosus]|nr:hypothetical protein J1614_000047 [Plenodomus biglobosus]
MNIPKPPTTLYSARPLHCVFYSIVPYIRAPPPHCRLPFPTQASAWFPKSMYMLLCFVLLLILLLESAAMADSLMDQAMLEESPIELKSPFPVYISNHPCSQCELHCLQCQCPPSPSFLPSGTNPFGNVTLTHAPVHEADEAATTYRTPIRDFVLGPQRRPLVEQNLDRINMNDTKVQATTVLEHVKDTYTPGDRLNSAHFGFRKCPQRRQAPRRGGFHATLVRVTKPSIVLATSTDTRKPTWGALSGLISAAPAARPSCTRKILNAINRSISMNRHPRITLNVAILAVIEHSLVATTFSVISVGNTLHLLLLPPLETMVHHSTSYLAKADLSSKITVIGHSPLATPY